MGFPGRVWGLRGGGVCLAVSREGLRRLVVTQMPALVIQPGRWDPTGTSGEWGSKGAPKGLYTALLVGYLARQAETTKYDPQPPKVVKGEDLSLPA